MLDTNIKDNSCICLFLLKIYHKNKLISQISVGIINSVTIQVIGFYSAFIALIQLVLFNSILFNLLYITKGAHLLADI